MKKIILFFGVFLFWNCSSDNSFFDFDVAIHYSIKQQDELHFNNSQNEEEKREFQRIFYGFDKYPSSIKDKDLIKKIEKYYSIKREIPEKNIQVIDSLFTQRSYKNDGDYACEPLYNDIIIFKKNGVIVGLAKICFQCHKHYILGSEKKTDCFGRNGEFETLKKIL